MITIKGQKILTKAGQTFAILFGTSTLEETRKRKHTEVTTKILGQVIEFGVF